MTREQLDALRDVVERHIGESAAIIPNTRVQLLISHIDAQRRKIDRLREAIAHMLYSADAMWEEKNMGHDWPEACDYARDTLKETE